MSFPKVFDKNVSEQIIKRINTLTPATTPKWGKMNVAQMLAHCNVTYEMVYEDKHPKPGAIMKFILKSFIKKVVTGDKPYKHNSQTAPAFIMTDQKEFDMEKNRLINYITKTQQLGESHFNNKESHSFGPLTGEEWNTMFYKHLDHHLSQFGV